MTSPRWAPPFWRHDAYTLRRLGDAVRAVAAELSTPPTSLAVDLGAGDAPYRGLFEAHGWQYQACDIDATPGSAILRIEPGRDIELPDGAARLVLSFQVLEHVWDLDWYLGQARRLLASDGHLIISTHGTWLYHPHPTDYRRWTRSGLLAELSSRGLQPVSVRALVGPLAWTTQFRALGWNRLLAAIPLLGKLLAAMSNSLHHARMLLEDRLTPQAWRDENAAIYLVIARPGPVPEKSPDGRASV